MLEAIERTLFWFSSFVLDGDTQAACQLQAPLDDETVMTHRGDLASFIEIRGARRMVGTNEILTMTANVAALLGQALKAGNGSQHSFAIGFRSSPESSVRLLHEIMDPSIATAQRFATHDLVYQNDQLLALSKTCKEESVYLVLYTHLSGLSPTERVRAQAAYVNSLDRYSKANPKASLNGESVSQVPKWVPQVMVDRHIATRNNFLRDLTTNVESGGGGVLATVLEASAGLSLLRRHLDASNFASSWRPRLVGDPSTVHSHLAQRPGSAAHDWPMQIGRQLVSSPMTEYFSDVECVRRDGVYYAGVVMEVPPESGGALFSELCDRIGRSIPWTVNFEIIPNGLESRSMDKLLASFVGSMGDNNKRVQTAHRALREMSQNGVQVVAIRVLAVTWADSESEVAMRLSALKSSVESWGSATCTNETGAPALLALSAAPGYSARMPAQYLPGPIDAFAKMLPLAQPASPWNNGHLVAHTLGGRPYPIMFGSTAQNFWGTLIFAPPGSGKSFLMNMINVGILFAPGIQALPYLVNIDVGPSSRLLIDYLKAVLPPLMLPQVAYLRVRNTKDYAVNPFDTQPGCDAPTQVDRDFQTCVVETVSPGLGAEGSRFVGQVIDDAYRALARSSTTQRKWQQSMDEQISRGLEKIGMIVSDQVTVWEVVDALFDAGEHDLAWRAQRHAVPRLSDLIKSAKSTEILNTYREAPSATAEKIIDVFCRNIQTAVSEYELIAGVTQFDVGSVKILSIDLEEMVTANESEEGRRRAALMFMFARRLGARNFFLRWDEIVDIVPQRYYKYQKERVSRLYESLKFLQYDEAQYANGIDSMVKLIDSDLRVGRKYNLITVMISQMLSTFSQSAVTNCYTHFILGGSEDNLKEMKATFALSDSEVLAISRYCTAPGKVFAYLKTKDGVTSQILCTTAGSFARWAFNTSTEDVLLRDALTSLLDGKYLQALKYLAAAYPGGSAREAMEKYQRSRGDQLDAQSVIDVMARKVLELNIA